MIRKKLHSPIYILLLTLLFVLQSCEKKPQDNPKKQSNLPEINRLIALGEKHFEKVEYNSSYYYFNKAKSLCDVKKDTAKIIYSLLNMATIEQNQGDYSGSETTATEAFPFLINNPKTSHHWGVYTTMGINCLKLYDYKGALYYDNKALNLKTDEYRKANSKNNIAVVYMEKEDYSKAIEILLPLTLKKENVKNFNDYARFLDNLGYSYYKTGNSKGLSYMNQALKIRKQRKDDGGMLASYYNLSEYYKKNNPNLSFNYARLGYEKATKINCADDRLQCLKLLIENSTGNQLKNFSLDYIRINDSIIKVRQKAKNQFAKLKYDSKQEKEENLKLKSQKAENAFELEQQKNRNLLLYFLILIGFLATIFLYFFF